MRQPQLSIITPCLNQVDLLARCLAHVATLGPEVEHIVVDGASTDGSVALLQRTQRQRPDRFRFTSKPDRNLYEAVNRGLELTQAEVCTYLNCDDLLLPWAVETLLSAFAQQPETELLIADAIEWWPAQERAALIVHPPAPLVQTYLRSDGHLAQPAVFFRRRLIERLGGFSTDYRLLGDHDFWLRALEQGTTARRLWEFVAVQTMHADQLMARHAQLAIDERARIRHQHGLGDTPPWQRRARQLSFALLHRGAMITAWSTTRLPSWARADHLPWSQSAASAGLRFASLPELLGAILGSSAQRRYLALDLAALGFADPGRSARG